MSIDMIDLSLGNINHKLEKKNIFKQNDCTLNY